jgi:ribonuclease R
MGQRCSTTERRADEASWDVQAWLKCRYMEGRVGEEFGGRITGIADFGFFVQIDDALVEGLIHVSQLEAEYYEFRPDSQALVGRSTGRRFRLGDRVRVLCAGVRTDERKIDFALEEHVEQRRPAAGRTRTGGRGKKRQRQKGRRR